MALHLFCFFFTDDSDDLVEEECYQRINDLPGNAIPPEPQTSKKKIKRQHLWKQAKAKRFRNEGKAYVDCKGEIHEGKKLIEYNRQCRYKCNTNIPEELREEIFHNFWKLGIWDLQTSFLNGSIELAPVQRKSNNVATKNKSVSCVYKLGQLRVCQEFFKKTLCISNKRVQNVVCKKKMSDSGVSPRDRRGRKVPVNKIPQERIDIIKEHINGFPMYSSHYTRAKNPNRKYLPEGLTVKEMYKMYKVYCEDVKHVPPEKESFYRNIFNTQFNLSCHRPNTDTCDKCDKIAVRIETGTPEEKEKAEREKELHLRKAEATRLAKDKCKQNEDESHVTLCFDLQKPCQLQI